MYGQEKPWKTLAQWPRSPGRHDVRFEHAVVGQPGAWRLEIPRCFIPWLVVFEFSHSVGNFIIPIDEIIFFREGGLTTNQFRIYLSLVEVLFFSWLVLVSSAEWQTDGISGYTKQSVHLSRLFFLSTPTVNVWIFAQDRPKPSQLRHISCISSRRSDRA